MAATTGIGWTDATVNFVIGCTKVGPGCEHCYAAPFSLAKFNVVFGPGERRYVTQSGFKDPLVWQRKLDKGIEERVHQGRTIRTPRWVFACSLSDFFDNEWPPGVRDRAWDVIRQCQAIRWQIVTKRVGNVAKMLPDDWFGGRNYPNVGIIATVCDQGEFDRDIRKLAALKANSVRWIGLSIEPQLGHIDLGDWVHNLDWVICGGESKTDKSPARIFNMAWGRSLLEQCRKAGVPFFWKQMGDTTFDNDVPVKFKDAGTDPSQWPAPLRVQEMPRIYDLEPSRLLPGLF